MPFGPTTRVFQKSNVTALGGAGVVREAGGWGPWPSTAGCSERDALSMTAR